MLGSRFSALAPIPPATTRWALLVIIGVALGLRLAVVLYYGEAISNLPGIADEISYHTLAQRALAGDGFSFPINWWPATRAGEPTAHWSYLYTLFLAGVYGVFGPHPLAARLIQAVLAGVLYPWLAWRVGRRLFGAPAGLMAAGLIAVYGYFVYYASALMTETFYILALLWIFDLATALIGAPAQPAAGRSRARALLGAVRPWFLLGLAIGIAALCRQLVLVFIPALVAWLLWAKHGAAAARAGTLSRGWWRTAAGLALSGLVVAALIAPWTVRNYQAFGRLVLLNTNSGYAFFWGNHPYHGTNFIAILPNTVYQQLIPPELRWLDEAALDQALLQEGLRFVVADPARYALLSVSRLKDYFAFWPAADSSAVSNLVRVLSFGVYLPLMLFGVFLVTRHRAQLVEPGQWRGVVLLYLFIAGYSLIHLLSWALIRYRLPVDAALVPFAAVGAIDLIWRLSRLARPAARRVEPV